MDLDVDPRYAAAQAPVPFSGGYRASADMTRVRLLRSHRLAAVVLDEPVEGIGDEPRAVVLMQVAEGLGAHHATPPERQSVGLDALSLPRCRRWGRGARAAAGSGKIAGLLSEAAYVARAFPFFLHR